MELPKKPESDLSQSQAGNWPKWTEKGMRGADVWIWWQVRELSVALFSLKWEVTRSANWSWDRAEWMAGKGWQNQITEES